MHTGQVHVVVTDVDGLSASADHPVFINYTESGLAPICDKKPYLPQCKGL
jgi:hypothetical protein